MSDHLCTHQPVVHEPRDLAPSEYFACSEPERPHDAFTQYDLRCHRCRLAARATLATSSDVRMWFYDSVLGENRRYALSEALSLAESRYGR